MIDGQLTILDVLPQEHVIHLENSQGGITGTCGLCSYTFTGVADPALVYGLISDHCTPISE